MIDGVPRIGDGVYERAQLFTMIVPWFFQQFGESLVVARLPSAIAGSLLVIAVYVWTRSVPEVWLLGLLLCLVAPRR